MGQTYEKPSWCTQQGTNITSHLYHTYTLKAHKRIGEYIITIKLSNPFLTTVKIEINVITNKMTTSSN
jgi:hypothetical protein